ncbi:MAG: hypothetical protein IPM78_13655 [Moraxellaceae bacterium]|nr:hypothetical protein [Moraxellaceae bacterium]
MFAPNVTTIYASRRGNVLICFLDAEGFREEVGMDLQPEDRSHFKRQ